MMKSHPQASTRTVVIIDDDLGFLVWLGHTLAASGYLTVPAASGSQATSIIEEFQIAIDLVIANLELPGVTDLIDALKGRQESVKVIAIQDRNLGISLRSGFDASLSRSPSEWLSTVRRVLEEKRATGGN